MKLNQSVGNRSILTPGFFLLLFFSILGSSCSRENTGKTVLKLAATPPPNIVLISIDTLRQDRLSCYGHPRAVSPVIDSISRESRLFTRARCPIPVTTSSHATMFTGLLPGKHGSLGNGMPISISTEKLLASRLAELGYKSYGITSTSVLWPELCGIDGGFEFYTCNPPPPNKTARKSTPEKKKAERIDIQLIPFSHLIDGKSAIKDLQAMIPELPREKCFVFLHFYDVHMPYTPQDPFHQIYDPNYTGEVTGVIDDARIFHGNESFGRTYNARDAQHMRALYDGGVRQADMFTGRALRMLADAGILDNAMIIVTSDHGENFGDFNSWFEHGRQLTEATLRIPYIIKMPGNSIRIIDFPAALEDFVPTLITCAGGEPRQEEFDGIDLSSMLLRDRIIPAPHRYVETSGIRGRNGSFKRYGIIHDGFKYLCETEQRDAALFYPRELPGDAVEVTGQYPQVSGQLKKLLEIHREAYAVNLDEKQLSEIAVQQLKALGYIE